MLLDVDLLVYKEDGNDGLSIDLKQRAGDEAMDWTVCSALVTAARALETAIKGEARVHPVMMLLDASADDSFRAFSTSQSVAFVEIDTRNGTVEVSGAPENHDLRGPAEDVLARLTGRAAPSGDGAGTDVPAEQAR